MTSSAAVAVEVIKAKGRTDYGARLTAQEKADLEHTVDVLGNVVYGAPLEARPARSAMDEGIPG